MSIVTNADLTEWQGAIGRTTARTQRLDSESLRRFSVAVGGEGDVASARPPLAHWAWFLDAAADSEIGEDGHPRRGGFLPAIGKLPRRMFASTSIRFGAALLLDEEAQMAMRIVDIRHKSGRSGDLVFLEIERVIAQAGEPRVTERQSLVYREAADDAANDTPVAMPVPAADAETVPPGGEVWRPGPFNLFRFSAATFNGHRIHYDAPYATGVEGYPGLVVHGPFVAARLAALAAGKGALATFAFRAQAPIFAGQPIRLVQAGEGEVHAIRCDGTISAIAKATYI